MPCICFWVWIPSLRMIFSSSIHLHAELMRFSFHCVKDHIFCIHSSVVRHQGCFQFLDITNKAAINIAERVSLWHGGESIGNLPESDRAAHLGRFIYSFLGNLQIDLQSHQKWRTIPFCSNSWQQMLPHVILILVILTGMRWNLRVVCICISLINKDFEHIYKFFTAIWYSSGVNSLLNSISHLLNCTFFLVVSFLSSLFCIVSLYHM